MSATPPVYRHDLNARLDYGVEWSAWLEDGDAVDSVEWIAGAGLVLTGELLVGTVATVRVAVDPSADPPVKVGDTLRATCRATFTSGQIDDQSIDLFIVDK